MANDRAYTPPERARPLIKKLAEVMGAVGYIAKTGTNTAQNYKYARESDIVQAIRGELSTRHVMVIPDVLEVVNHERQRSDGKPGVPLTRVKVVWHLIDGETGDEMTVCAFGDAMDSGDKGYYKAMTGCQKYLWMKMLHLPTGDDPEADRAKRVDQDGNELMPPCDHPGCTTRARYSDGDKNYCGNHRPNKPAPAPRNPANGKQAMGDKLVAQERWRKAIQAAVDVKILDSIYANPSAEYGQARKVLLGQTLEMPETWAQQLQLTNVTIEQWTEAADRLFVRVQEATA